jgi:translation initiation factor 2B subunit (eIF-2B alpha/beta/delta family)
MNKNPLEKIINNNKAGSSEILLQLKKYLLKNYNDLRYLRKCLKEVKIKLRHFASIQNFIEDLSSILRTSNETLIKLYLQNSIKEQVNAVEKLFASNRKIFIKIKTITTISHSRTLVELFKIWNNNLSGLKIIILESRPILEGRRTTEILANTGIECILMTDAMMIEAVKQCDAVFIGADQILVNGNIVNKSGSYPLALCAKFLKKPFYVVTNEDKFVNKNFFKAKDSSPDEIWLPKNKRIKILNRYFEEVPSKLITRIIKS